MGNEIGEHATRGARFLRPRSRPRPAPTHRQVARGLVAVKRLPGASPLAVHHVADGLLQHGFKHVVERPRLVAEPIGHVKLVLGEHGNIVEVEEEGVCDGGHVGCRDRRGGRRVQLKDVNDLALAAVVDGVEQRPAVLLQNVDAVRVEVLEGVLFQGDGLWRGCVWRVRRGGRWRECDTAGGLAPRVGVERRTYRLVSRPQCPRHLAL